jgi:ATP-binding cassette, subfamily F, member 3
LLVADGTVRPFDGDLDDYRALMGERGRPTIRRDAPNKRNERRERADARAAIAPLRRRAKDAEARMAKLDGERARLQAKLLDPALYEANRSTEVTDAQTRLAAVVREAAAAEEEWLAASQALEAAS